MRKLIAVCAAAVLLGSGAVALAASLPGHIAAAVAKTTRPEADRVRDPLRRPGDHAGLEGLAVFFASPHSDYITGQCLPVDGGLCIS